MQPLREITDMPTLSPRSPLGHKGTYGKVLIVAGSTGMSGAAILTAMGALRGGAGLVQLAIPESIQSVVSTYNPCYLTAPLPADGTGQITPAAEELIVHLAAASDVVAVGPGLGNSETVTHLVKTIWGHIPKPVVVDADALNSIVPILSWLSRHSPAGPRILTPHPGEFSRLTKLPTDEIVGKREELAAEFANRYGIHLILKGHQSLVTDGTQLYRNATGNSGMATGGTGDVLTGLIAALLAQGLEPFDAAQLGVYLHGLAGDLARDELGAHSLIASDLVDWIPDAFREVIPPSSDR